jgi:hypothetical protein
MKHTQLLKHFLTFTSILSLGVTLEAEIISVNIGGSIDPTRVLTDFGAPDYNSVAGNWNNIGFDFTNLLWDDGTESTVGVIVTFPWGKVDDFGADRRFGSGTAGTPLHHGPNIYPTTPDTGLSFFNLSDNFPDGFFAIVYLTGFANAEGAVTDGRTPYYFRTGADLTIPLTPDGLIQTTTFSNPGVGNFPVSHYAVYGSKEVPLRSDALTLNVESIARGVSLGGVQFVSASDVTEPATWAGYEVDALGNINTGTRFMRWLAREGQSDWLYSYSANQYVYAPESFISKDSGGWVYVFDQALLNPDRVTDIYYVATAFDTWVASFGAEVGTGDGWIYIYDLSAY